MNRSNNILLVTINQRCKNVSYPGLERDPFGILHKKRIVVWVTDKYGIIMMTAREVTKRIKQEMEASPIKNYDDAYWVCAKVLREATNSGIYSLHDAGLIDLLHKYAESCMRLQYMSREEKKLSADSIAQFEEKAGRDKAEFIRKYNSEYLTRLYEARKESNK